MVIMEMIFWWYAYGWSVFCKKIKKWLSGIIDFFSMGSLARTLFKPFRQISAEGASETASLDMKFHAFIDGLVSRIVGFFSRIFILLFGFILIIISGVVSAVLVVAWPIIPLLPAAGIVMSVMGVTI